MFVSGHDWYKIVFFGKNKCLPQVHHSDINIYIFELESHWLLLEILCTHGVKCIIFIQKVLWPWKLRYGYQKFICQILSMDTTYFNVKAIHQILVEIQCTQGVKCNIFTHEVFVTLKIVPRHQKLIRRRFCRWLPYAYHIFTYFMPWKSKWRWKKYSNIVSWQYKWAYFYFGLQSNIRL